MPRRKRVLSGMRPTGRLHIGHYFGALQNWIKLQDDPQYECFFFIADWHALTTDYADSLKIDNDTIEIATDWLAVGLGPAKCTMFVQSQVPRHAELHLLLSMITPLGWLERVPTYKEQLENIGGKDLHTYGFLGYPVLQAADIVMYGSLDAELYVPVGEDQVAHVEATREIVRRFNAVFGLRVKDELFDQQYRDDLWGVLERISESRIQPFLPLRLTLTQRIDAQSRALIRGAIRSHAAEVGVQNFLESIGSRKIHFLSRPVLREPSAILTEMPRLPGTDGRKMSKSYGNVIELSESDESIRAKTKVMMTDPARKRREDPGNPDVCPVFSWHKLFSTPETIAWSDQGCRTAGIGCIECKEAMADGLIKWIAPIRARRQEYEADPERVSEILREGSKRAQKVARKTMRRVREAVFGSALPAKARRNATKTQAAMGS